MMPLHKLGICYAKNNNKYLVSSSENGLGFFLDKQTHTKNSTAKPS